MVELAGTKVIKGCKPSPRYQKYFNQINILYFDGSLPSTKVLVAPLLKITSLSQKKASSGSWKDAGSYGMCGISENDEYIIVLDKGTSIFHSIITKQTVLHEAIHLYIGLDKGHGKAFKTQIRRIASLGALDNLI